MNRQNNSTKVRISLVIVSLFLTPQEEACLESQLNKSLSATTRLTHNQAGFSLHLDGILYASPERWTVWINGQGWNASDKREKGDIKIQKVTKDYIIIDYKKSSKAMRRTIKLYPHQIYLIQEDH